MGFDEFSDSEFRKIYRKGRVTLNQLAGQPGEYRMTADPEEGPEGLRNSIKKKTNDDYWYTILMVIFYAGVKSKIVDRYEERIAFNFQEWQRAAHYIEPTIQKMLNDPKMFKH